VNVMSRGTQSRSEGYTLGRAVNEIFGRPPGWPWSIVAWIAAGGVVGAIVAGLLAPAAGPPHPALRWAACAGYGVVVASLIVVLPRAVRLATLRVSLAKRPADDSGERAWWPLQLLTAALRGTSTLRLTRQDFDAAVNRAWPTARSILVQRFWPAWVAAFVVPLRQFVPQVSPPMVATIAAALVLMVVLAVVDQLTAGLLQHWSRAVQFSDHGSEVVAGGQDPLPPTPAGPSVPEVGIRGPDRETRRGETPSGTEGPTVADLEKMAEDFSNRGRKP